MTIATLATWSLTAISVCISTCALFVARRTSDRSHLRRLSELCERLDQVEELQTQLAQALRRERSRATMSAMRARQKVTEQGEPSDSANGYDSTTLDPEIRKDIWTRETNLKLATGQIKVR